MLGCFLAISSGLGGVWFITVHPTCPPAPCLQNTGTRRVTWFHSERVGGECWGRENSCYLFTFECEFVSSSGSPAPWTELSKQEFQSWSRWGVSSGVRVRQPYSDAHKAPGVWGEGRREEGAGLRRRQPCSWRSSPAPVRTPRPCSLSFKASQVANPPGVLQWCGENRIFFF